MMGKVQLRHPSVPEGEAGIFPVTEALGGDRTTQIFVHSMTQFGIFQNVHDQKALIMARKGDLVCVSSPVDDAYLRFLKHLGIGPQEGNVITVTGGRKPETLGERLADLLRNDQEAFFEIRSGILAGNSICINPYIASRREFDLATTLGAILGKEVSVNGGRPAIVDFIMLKHHCRTKALKLGIPVPAGEIVFLPTGQDGRPQELGPLRSALSRVLPRTGGAVVRGSMGASGSSLFIVRDRPESIRDALDEISRRKDNNIYLVDEMLPVTTSSNILVHVEKDNGRVFCVGVTDQILDQGFTYQGSLFPTKALTVKKMVKSAVRMSRWLQAEGYAGLAGFDFGEYRDPITAEIKYSLFEINPRTNASVYPLALMELLNAQQKRKHNPRAQAFLSAKTFIHPCAFSSLKDECGRFFYRPETGKGLIPYDVGRLKEGRFISAFLGENREEVLQMHRALKSHLNRADSERARAAVSKEPHTPAKEI
jgi:hypothetical protein